jgi:hypothetical protein
MTHTFNVGDKVRLVNRRPTAWNQLGKMDKFLGEVVTIKSFHDQFNDLFTIKEEPWWLFHIEEIVEVIPNIKDELHITVNGRKTIGVYKHDGKTDKAVAKCSPEDTFDFATGVKLVCERLSVLPTESTPVRVNVPQYFTGRVICVQTDYDFWTKGKIYEVNNGEIRDNDGDLNCWMTLEMLERGIGSKDTPVKFINLVE